jgi:hypothetical protein
MSNAAAEAVAYWLTVAMLAAGPLTLLIGLLLHRLAGLSAPYGRFASDGGPGWGPLLPGRFAWVVSAGAASTEHLWQSSQKEKSASIRTPIGSPVAVHKYGNSPPGYSPSK